MALSVSESRAALTVVYGDALGELRALFASMSGMSADEVRDALIDVLPILGDSYGLAAGALAADWFDDLREAAGVSGAFRAEPAAAVTVGRWESLARWGVGPLYSATPSHDNALTLVGGGLQRTIANHHRGTVVENAARDPKAVGWKRVGVGGNCLFCAPLIARGAVYTDQTVTFRTHDHCDCVAAPSWG